MPIYEYRCQNCNKVMEVLANFNDPAPDSCEFCSHGPMTKIMSQTSFVLKGTGWYVTDYKNAKSKQKNSEDKTSDASKSSDSEAKDSAPKATSGEQKSESNADHKLDKPKDAKPSSASKESSS